VQDVQICPVCGEPVEYDYRRYHHIGRAHCASCGWHSYDADYQLISADTESGRMTVMEAEVWQDYKMPSPEIYNLYNALAAIALLRSMDYPAEKIAEAMEKLAVVESRLHSEEIGRWRLTSSMAKGLNAVACSRNFDMVLHTPGKKAVVLLLDDVFDEKSSSENIAWLYDADFELLDDPEIVQVLAVGVRCLDTKLRLLLAGVSPEKVKAVHKAADAAKEVALADCEQVFVLFEVYRLEQAKKVRSAIAERMRKE
jgi:UDP-N-acetylmuramyl tripeptide synthase